MNNYIHIPFCNQKCTYCKFALTPVFDEYKKKKYLKFLENEIIEKLKKYPNQKAKTIYFGGGTPSILKIEEISKIINLFDYDKNTEITLESNPEDLNEEYLENLFKIWINRLSIWIQTLNSESLEKIERKNNESIFLALESIKKVLVWKVWKNILDKISINTDFILGLPKVKYLEIYENIKFLHKKYNFITHTSVYFLEKWIYPKNWQNETITENETIQEFQKICEFLKEKNFNHYEISNFAKKWYECKHNIGYWKHENYLWFGLSASEFIYDEHKKIFKRSINSTSFSGYYNKKIEYLEELNEKQIELEKFLFGIRTTWYEFNEKNIDLNFEKIKKFLEEKKLEWNEKNFKISENYIHLIDNIIDEIII